MTAEGEPRAGEPPGDDDRYPPFVRLCLGLYAQAQVALGLHPDPLSGVTGKDLPTARQAIDLLGVLEEKTKGNLTAQESALLGGLLSDVRLAYVREASKP